MSENEEGNGSGDREMNEEFVDISHHPIGEIGKGYSIGNQVLELDLTNNKIKKIENLDHCVQLECLILRQNEIEVIEGLNNLPNLIDLDLYMNSIKELTLNCFQAQTKLKRLDLSFNQLRTMVKINGSHLKSLVELYLISNKITSIDNPLEELQNLELLELGDNRIRTIENLDALVNLKSLWLGRNKIARLENLEMLKNLKILSMQSNRIMKLENLDALDNLEELYLSHNGISKMEGLLNLKRLRLLDLGNNRIENIEQVDQLQELQELWINNNKLEDFDDLKLITHLKHIDTVYLEGNPLYQDGEYQNKVMSYIPHLKQLDAVPITR